MEQFDYTFQEILSFLRDLKEFKCNEEAFLKKYPYKIMRDGFNAVWKQESETFADCMYRQIRLADLITDLTFKQKNLLVRNYPFLIGHYLSGNTVLQRLRLPLMLSFGGEKTELNNMLLDQSDSLPLCAIAERLLRTIPPGRVRLTLIDTSNMGNRFNRFLQLISGDDPDSKRVISDGILTSKDEIEMRMQTLIDLLKVNEKHLAGLYKSVGEFNDVSVEPLPYYFLIAADFPNGFTKESLTNLKRIVIGGRTYGLFVILQMTSWDVSIFPSGEQEECKKLVDEIVKYVSANLQLHSDGQWVAKLGDMSKFSSTEYWLMLPKASDAGMLSKLKPDFMDCLKRNRNPHLSLDKLDRMEEDRKNCRPKPGVFYAPIGIRDGTEVVYLSLGMELARHAIVLGNAGMGKTNLLQTIVLETLKRFPEEEIGIYLIDFKHGRSFGKFADHLLPQIRTVTRDSSPEFCCRILAEVRREMDLRAEKYNSSAVEKHPHILVVIDDLKEMFDSQVEQSMRDQAISDITKIVQNGGSFGIHLIMASQNFNDISRANLIGQIAARIVFSVSPSEAASLIDDGNEIVKEFLTTDQGKAVINCQAGRSEYSSVFIVPKLQDKDLQNLGEMQPDHALIPQQVLTVNPYDVPIHPFNWAYAPTEDYLHFGCSVTPHKEAILPVSQDKLLLLGGADVDAEHLMLPMLISLCLHWKRKNGGKPTEPIITLTDWQNASAEVDAFLGALDGSYLRRIPEDKIQLVSTTDSPHWIFVAQSKAFHKNIVMRNLMRCSNVRLFLHWSGDYTNFCNSFKDENGRFDTFVALTQNYPANWLEANHTHYAGDCLLKTNTGICLFKPYQKPGKKWLEKLQLLLLG